MTLYKLTPKGKSSATKKVATGRTAAAAAATTAIATGLDSVEVFTANALLAGSADADARVVKIVSIAAGTVTVAVYRGHDAAADVLGMEVDAAGTVSIHWMAVGD